MTPALPGEAPDPSATPRLDALLKEVEALNLPGPTGVTLTTMGRAVIVGPDSLTTRLAAMLRVAVEALNRLDDTGGSMWSMPSTDVAVSALARIEAMAKGEA